MRESFDPLKLKGAEILSYILDDVKLRDYQVRAMIHIAELDCQLLAFDTGLGKTLAMIAGLVAKQRKGIKVRTLYLSPLRGLSQVKESFQRHTRLKVATLTGSRQSLARRKRSTLDADVLLVNYEAFDEPLVLEYILDLVNDNYFNCVVADEAHVFANIFTSNRNFFISNIVRQMKYRYFLTATPVVSKFQQYAAIVAMMLDDLNNLGSYVSRVKDGQFRHDHAPHFVQFRERKDNYKVQLHLTPEIKVGRALYGSEVFKYTRGTKNADVEEVMINLIKNTGKKLLIFSHLKSNHQYLKHLAESLGRKVGIISGDTGTAAQEPFNNGELDCIVFSVPAALNLPADSIIMYDWTNLAHQAIGRGIRTEEIGNYTAHFILTQTPKELSLFQNTVIKSAVYLEESLGKAIEPILNLQEL